MVILFDNSYLKVGLENNYNSKKKLSSELFILDPGKGDLYVMYFRFVNESIDFEPLGFLHDFLIFQKIRHRSPRKILKNRGVRNICPTSLSTHVLFPCTF